MELGIQISSLKPLLLTQASVRETFSRLKALHTPTVQLQWIDPSVSIEAIADALAENGLVSVSVQDFYETVAASLPYYMELNGRTGGSWLCVSRIPERFKSLEGLDMFVRELRALGKRLEKVGQKLCFHPVSADYSAIPGCSAVDILLTKMPELDICLDLYHVQRSGLDMKDYLRRYAGRVCMVHFKDALGATLVPAGQGDIDWDGVVQTCRETGVPYGFAEQERWEKDPVLCLEEALDWLRGQ